MKPSAWGKRPTTLKSLSACPYATMPYWNHISLAVATGSERFVQNVSDHSPIGAALWSIRVECNTKSNQTNTHIIMLTYEPTPPYTRQHSKRLVLNHSTIPERIGVEWNTKSYQTDTVSCLHRNQHHHIRDSDRFLRQCLRPLNYWGGPLEHRSGMKHVIQSHKYCTVLTYAAAPHAV